MQNTGQNVKKREINREKWDDWIYGIENTGYKNLKKERKNGLKIKE